MKKIRLIYLFTFMSVSLIIINSCKKDDNTINPEPAITKPVLTTTSFTDIKQSTVTGGGNISSNGGADITARGICWSQVTSPSISDKITSDGVGTGSFTSNITGLSPNTTYYARAYATNSAGTAYGNEISFTTLADTLTVTDIDGNLYHTVTIGSQVWLVENLKVTHLNDGSVIPEITDNNAWGALTTPGYCWYNNNYSTYGSVFGGLYNWYAVNSGKLCPQGWHVPTSAEWATLTDYLDGEDEAGGKLKEAGTTHWLTPNTDATNETGFTALPGGSRYYVGYFQLNINENGYWWSSTGYSSTYATYIVMTFTNSSAWTNGNYKEAGFSVRCIQD